MQANKDKVLFFTLETTGLVDKDNYEYPSYKLSEKYNRARIIKISWIYCDKDKNKISGKNYLIKPKNFTIEKNIEKINGITHDDAVNNGKSLKYVVKRFLKHIDSTKFIISHNLQFHYNILLAELYRNGYKKEIEKIKTLKPMCLGNMTRDIIKLDGTYGYKFPSLEELYSYCFNKKLKNKHRKMKCVKTIKDCFYYFLNNNDN